MLYNLQAFQMEWLTFTMLQTNLVKTITRCGSKALGASVTSYSFESDANNDIILTDGTSDFQITNTGNQLSHELGAGSPIASYITFSLDYNAMTGDATLTDSLGGNHGVITSFGTGATDRVLFGATSGGGFGSTTWNSVSLETTAVPEPSSLALVGLAVF